jgi:hypothetical protein
VREEATPDGALSTAERAELDRLRRRAYGADADIDTDPAALARLVDLEERVRRTFEAPSAADDERGDAAPPAPPTPASMLPASTAVVAPPVSEEPTATVLPAPSEAPPSAPRRGKVALIGALALGVVTVGAIAANTEEAAGPAASPPAVAVPAAFGALPDGIRGSVLLEIPLGRSLARSGVAADPPTSPVAEGLRWSSQLGTYYGWDLWLARSHLGSACLVVARGTESEGACVIPESFADGDLVVSVPFADVDEGVRPPAMTATERIEYRWLPDRGVVVLRAGGSITYFGPTD